MKYSKKLGVFLVSMVFALQAAGGGKSEPPANSGRTQNDIPASEKEASSEERQQAEMTDAGTTESTNDGKILIAYFSAGENSDVDAVSSASVVTVDGEAKGRLRAVADMIQDETGGTLFSIQTAVRYPGDGGALIDYAAEEQDEYDFSGKTIIPFNVHNGSRFSGTIETIQDLEPDAEVITDGFTVSERDVAGAAGDVADWLGGLNY